MTTSTKSNQAAQAIIAAGHQPTPELINAVLEEKSKDNRVSFATAARRALSAQTAQPDNGQNSGQRQSDNGQSQTGSGHTVEQVLEASSQALANTMKKAIVSEALSRVVADLAAGDFGDFNVPLGELGALDVNFSQVIEAKPFRALPSNTGNAAKLSLPSAEMNGQSETSNG